MNKIIFLGFFFTLQIATAQTIVEPTIPATGMTYPVTIMNDTMAFGNPPWDFSIYNPTQLLEERPFLIHIQNFSHYLFLSFHEFLVILMYLLFFLNLWL